MGPTLWGTECGRSLHVCMMADSVSASTLSLKVTTGDSPDTSPRLSLAGPASRQFQGALSGVQSEEGACLRVWYMCA